MSNRRLLLAALVLVFSCMLVGISSVSRSRGTGLGQSKTVQSSMPKTHELELKAIEDSSDIGSFDTSWLQLSRDRLIVTVDRMVYMLSDGKTVKWVRDIPDMIDSPIVTAIGELYGIAADNKQFSIDAATGKVKFFDLKVAGSHSSYTQIKAYKANQYLVVENMEFYRDRDNKLGCAKCPLTNDTLFAWDGERFMWSTDFPPNAELQVWGNRILAVSKKKNGVVVREIELPKSK